MDYELNRTTQKLINEMLQSNRLVILLEIILVLTPTYVSLFLGYRPESKLVELTGELVLLGEPLIGLGRILTLGLGCG